MSVTSPYLIIFFFSFLFYKADSYKIKLHHQHFFSEARLKKKSPMSPFIGLYKNAQRFPLASLLSFLIISILFLLAYDLIKFKRNRKSFTLVLILLSFALLILGFLLSKKQDLSYRKKMSAAITAWTAGAFILGVLVPHLEARLFARKIFQFNCKREGKSIKCWHQKNN